MAAASFITADHGWALGSTGCDGCVGVAVTNNGGTTWAYLPTPPATLGWYSRRSSAVTDIAFADRSRGYLFAPGLLATTDGGHTWTDQHLTGIKTLTIAGSSVYALTGYDNAGAEQLYRSTLGTNTWAKVTLPGAANRDTRWETAAAGPDLVLLETGASSADITASQVGRVWISTDRGVVWQPRTVPCTTRDGGALVLAVAHGHPQAWLIGCYDNNQSSQEQNTTQHIYGTTDEGRTWVRLGDPPQHNQPVLLADNGAGHAFIATEGGVGDTLNGTFDGGQNWTVQIRDGGSFYGWTGLEFVSPNTGFAVGPTHYAPPHLYRTNDGGQTWTTLSVAP